MQEEQRNAARIRAFWSGPEVWTPSRSYLCFVLPRFVKRVVFRPKVEDENANRSEIPSGYTYFGQFVTHDLFHGLRNENGLGEQRPPALNLDSLYGRGPEQQPELYDKEPVWGTLKTFIDPNTRIPDLARKANGPLIAEPLNDENAILAQLHLAFARAHNRLLSVAPDTRPGQAFDLARRCVTKLFQYIVINDYLGRVIPEGLATSELEAAIKASVEEHRYVPSEFAFGAFRFGHSMIRERYRSRRRGLKSLPIFDERQNALSFTGGRPLTEATALNWSWFVDRSRTSDNFPERVDPAELINTRFSSPLAAFQSSRGLTNLAELDTRQGLKARLVPATVLAKSYGYDKISITWAEPDAIWYYVLKEAQETQNGHRLGDFGSAIVRGTLLGILASDPDSILNDSSPWHPENDLLLSQCSELSRERNFELRDVIDLAGL